jgi:excisionase family DNA binding protein
MVRLLKPEEFAAMVGLKVSTVRCWIWRKRIPYVKLGRAVRIRQDVAENLIESGSVDLTQNGTNVP